MFKPERVFITDEALSYPLGKQLYTQFKHLELPIKVLKSNRVTGIPGKSSQEKYEHGKRTLVIMVRSHAALQTCKPSAHFQLPLVTGCMGKCEYCYLQTRFGRQPYVRIYVNINDILDQAQQEIVKRGELTIFEGAATSDPVPVEPYTGSLARCINFFAEQPQGRFRFVTKYTDIDTLLKLDHRNHTEIRVSINPQTFIAKYEHQTPNLAKRLATIQKLMRHGYPVGVLIAPVFIFPGWQDAYLEVIEQLRAMLPQQIVHPLTFEIITHRFTSSAKKVIQSIYPESELPMEEAERTYRYGQFGYGKYVYTKEQYADVKAFFTEKLKILDIPYEIKYII